MISNVRSHPLTTSVRTPRKFTQKKIKISSQGLFFNSRDMEKQIPRIGEGKVSFFRPFNSTFERETHIISKQKKNFNKDAGMKATPFTELVSKEDLKSRDRQIGRAISNSLSGPVGPKLQDNAVTEVISGIRALTKQKQLQNNGHVKRIFNGYIKGGAYKTQRYAGTSSRNYCKTDQFVPFVDERDNLGYLKNSDLSTEVGQNSGYVRKLMSLPQA